MSRDIGLERIVQVNGVSYYTQTRGHGEPVLLLHGFTGSADTWNIVGSALATDFTVITVDILGHARTSAPSESSRYTIEQIASDLAQVMKALEYSCFSCVGYSLGGRLAIALTCLWPQQIKRLVVESGSPGLATAIERQTRQEADERLAAWLLSVGIEQFVDYWENISLFSGQRTLPLAVRQQERAIRLSHTPIGLANSLRGMGSGAQPSFWGALDQFTQPVLLLTGQSDQKFCSIAEKMNALIPTAWHVSIAQAGHTIHLEATQAFIQQVYRFLQTTG